MYTVLANCIQRADGAFIPADPSNSDYAAYLEWIDAGNTPDLPQPPTHAELVDIAKDEIRVVRQPVMGVLDGLQASYITKSDIGTATVIEVAKQALRDITKVDLSACENLAQMKVVVMTRYAQIAAASPALKSAFSQAVQ